MRTRLGILMAAVLGGVLALPASGQMMGQTGQGGPMGHMAGGMMGREMGSEMREGWGRRSRSHEGPLISMVLKHGQELGLSPEQEKKLRDLRTDFAKESIRRTAEIRVGEIELESLLEQGQWDLAKIEPKVKQIAGLQADFRLVRLKTLEAGRRVLTPEQLERVKQIGHRMQGMGGPGMMGPGPQMGPGMPGLGGPPMPRQ
jgi:Spy/CpxP family protein refolding chaperone